MERLRLLSWVFIVCVSPVPAVNSMKSNLHLDEYIIVVEDDAINSKVLSTTQAKFKAARDRLGFSASSVMDLGNKLVYRAKVSDTEAAHISTMTEVLMVEKNRMLGLPTPVPTETLVNQGPLKPSAIFEESAEDCKRVHYGNISGLWGHERISQRDWWQDTGNITYSYSEDEQGFDVIAYVVDTGISLSHVEFEGRAVWGFTDPDISDEGDTDLEGHGTHVAGTIGGRTVGLAKKATLVAVKVLNSTGFGSYYGIMLGIQFIREDVARRRSGNRTVKAVVNMSLGGYGGYELLANIINLATDEGIIFVAAAGNDGWDTCEHFPSNITRVISVGASNQYDELAYFSNYGRCVNVVAPGTLIYSSVFNQTDSSSTYARYSGTSMACPHVAGVIARLLSVNSSSTECVMSFLCETATEDALLLYPWQESTPNKLLYAECQTNFMNAAQCEAADCSFNVENSAPRSTKNFFTSSSIMLTVVVSLSV